MSARSQNVDQGIFDLVSEHLPQILELAKSLAKQGIVAPTVRAISNTYLELAVLFVCFVEGMLKLSIQDTGRIGEDLRASLVSYEVGDLIWKDQAQAVYLAAVLDDRRNVYWGCLGSIQDGTGSMEQVSECLDGYIGGNAPEFGEERASVVNAHVAQLIRLVRSTCSQILDLLGQPRFE